MCYVRVVEFLEKVINGIQTSSALSSVEEIQKPTFVRRVTSVGKILPVSIPLSKFEFFYCRDEPSPGNKVSESNSGKSKMF